MQFVQNFPQNTLQYVLVANFQLTYEKHQSLPHQNNGSLESLLHRKIHDKVHGWITKHEFV